MKVSCALASGLGDGGRLARCGAAAGGRRWMTPEKRERLRATRDASRGGGVNVRWPRRILRVAP
jgi:hypothetical protein